MEKYSLLNKLEDMATANGWVFLAGDNFYQNYESVMHEYEPGQCILGVDFVASDVFNDYGVLTGINYIGSIRLGRKVDSDTLTASLDETFKQKHDRRLMDLKVLLSNALSDLACENQLQITNSVGILEINKFDANIDFVGLQITFNQDNFGIEQPTYYPLVMATGTGGTIQPEAGTYSYLKNTIVPIVAIADNGYRFVNWVVNGVNDVKNLTTVTMASAVTAVANWEFLGVFFEKLKTFITAPVNRGNWYFGDYSGKDNDVRIKGQRVATFNLTSTIATTIKMNGQSPVEFKIKLRTSITVTGFKNFFYSDNTTNGVNGKGMIFQLTNNLLRIIIVRDGGIQSSYNFQTLQPMIHYDIYMYWNGLSGGACTITVNGYSITKIINESWTGLSANNIVTLYNLGDAQVSYVKLTNYFEYAFNHGQGATIYDILGNNNHGTVTGAVLSTFWGSTTNEAEPYEHTIGATLYRNTTDNSIMPICGDNNYTISGFIRIGYFPPASGALKGLPNTYTLVGNAEVPAGDYTADQIGAFVNSDLVQVTQTDNAITQLILKQ